MNLCNKIKKIDPEFPGRDSILEAAEKIKIGGVVVFPAGGLYGLAADSFDADAVEKLFRIKKRPSAKPILVLIKDEGELGRIVSRVTPQARSLMKKFWPGNVTIVLPARSGLSEVLTGRTGKIGVRLPGHPVALALAKASKNPLTGTSANLSGQPGCSDIEKLPREILQRADLVLDAGPLAGGVASTVVDATGSRIRVLREGKISSAEILAAVEEINVDSGF